MWALMIVVSFCTTVLIAGGWRLASIVIMPGGPSVEEALKKEIEKGFITEEWYNTLDKRAFQINSKQGYMLAGELFKANIPLNINVSHKTQQSPKVAIICHGFAFNSVGSLKYATMFLEMGYDVIVYDNRGAGKSGGKYTTMGYFERQDLTSVIDWVSENYGENCKIVLHGESMGAATVLLTCMTDLRVDFAISDCGFSDLKEQLAYRMKVEYKLPTLPFLPIASLFAKLRAKFWFGEVSPIKEMVQKKGLPEIPILFIHGAEDDYILPSMTQEMYNNKEGEKSLYIATGARHSGSFNVDREEYRRRVEEFINS